MKITANTKISELIKEDKNSIDALAAIAKPLEKLKNPILRKLMASRVTIAEAAKMGNATIESFAVALKPLGFEFEQNGQAIINDESGKPEWLTNLSSDKITNFDVREILSSGSDPLKEIMKSFKAVEIGNVLCIINTFVPTPLVRLFEKDNAITYTDTINENEFHTYFLKQGKKKAAPAPARELQIFNEDEPTFTTNKDRFTGKIKEIDVRHLEMPGPMQTILGELEILPKENALYVNHKRVPIYLLEELESKNFIIHIFNISETEVKLLIEHS